MSPFQSYNTEVRERNDVGPSGVLVCRNVDFSRRQEGTEVEGFEFEAVTLLSRLENFDPTYHPKPFYTSLPTSREVIAESCYKLASFPLFCSQTGHANYLREHE